MKAPDLDRERSEKMRTLDDFLKFYNKDLPPRFSRASLSTLTEFRKAYPTLFKNNNAWSLDQHRKKIMDWLPQHLETLH